LRQRQKIRRSEGEEKIAERKAQSEKDSKQKNTKGNTELKVISAKRKKADLYSVRLF
jgi:hypothetical protein